jgi:predicted GTPase
MPVGVDKRSNIDSRERVLIMGAGGRDFHVFNTCYRDNDRFRVVAFTAAQIPHIEHRIYPPELAGPLYPSGIPIHSEAELERLVDEQSVDEVVFAYSDVSFDFVESISARVQGIGARFSTFKPERTFLDSEKPCVAVCAVRTGCGKTPLSRLVAAHLRELGLRPGIIRHPMPYGNLRQQVVQRFATLEDLREQNCTIEEMEDYEPHIEDGGIVFAGADYQKIIAAAEAESDVLVWDGGNNDTPFVRPSLLITILDPLRAGHEVDYFPGKWNFEHADVLVIAKIDQATPEQLEIVHTNIERHNAEAKVIDGRLAIHVDDAKALRNRRVLIVEDGPTITHGGMGFGAGYLAAKTNAAEIVDPRPYAVGEIAEAYQKFPHVREVVPALGYADVQLADLQNTIQRVPCDLVMVATPMDLSRVIRIDQPTVRVTYAFEERGEAQLPELLRDAFVNRPRDVACE